ncbi:ethanolamine ammonia-lyase reactivating factor EutA [Desulfotomaculum sp. 1211_IL3151]|uniref:ethanolamine ammonia-lyase reactivating factor EutA n=1 Tax=Desulfotomaculum sp. 1211_IL3151 TaxID=3084055 RepID=UPI002FD96DBB
MSDKLTKELLSVGIDIGTTTTQLVISRIIVSNTAAGSAVPRMTITGKKILYRSDIHFTPLTNHEWIDAPAVTEIITREYHRAGITPAKVDTGAVIITGETAKKENARRISEAMAGYAGNFVVASAGPLMESIIAGRGAGAAATSLDMHRVCLNLDVGGGTSNLAVFKDGTPIDATCINIGGRLIELEQGGNTIKFLAPAARVVMQECGLALQVGERISLDQIRLIASHMAAAVKSLVVSTQLPQLSERLLMGPALRLDYPVQMISFSGGVADFVYSPEEIWSIPEGTLYGDIGPFLGEALRKAFIGEQWQLVKPKETIRATVIGAGAHTLSLSGSTVQIAPELLPIRNVPVVKPFAQGCPTNMADFKAGLVRQLQPYQLDGFNEPLAISLKGIGGVQFSKIQEAARAIMEGAKDYIASKQPLILILEEDCAKVLGQTLQYYLGHRAGIICLDQLCVDDGDYIDIGEPIMANTVVPVIIKTLVFESDQKKP